MYQSIVNQTIDLSKDYISEIYKDELIALKELWLSKINEIVEENDARGISISKKKIEKGKPPLTMAQPTDTLNLYKNLPPPSPSIPLFKCEKEGCKTVLLSEIARARHTEKCKGRETEISIIEERKHDEEEGKSEHVRSEESKEEEEKSGERKEEEGKQEEKIEEREEEVEIVKIAKIVAQYDDNMKKGKVNNENALASGKIANCILTIQDQEIFLNKMVFNLKRSMEVSDNEDEIEIEEEEEDVDDILN